MKHIVLCRIDDRLIHGQVVTAWVKQTEGNRIVTVSYTHLDVYKRQHLPSLVRERQKKQHLVPPSSTSLVVSVRSYIHSY